MARTLLASTLAGAAALRATRTTVSMHTNIFPTFTIKDKAAVLGQRLLPRRRDFFCFGGFVRVRMVLLPLRAARGGSTRKRGHRPDARRRAAAAVRRVARRERACTRET